MRFFMRQLEPSIKTVSAWWRRRSSTAEVIESNRYTVPLNTPGPCFLIKKMDEC